MQFCWRGWRNLEGGGASKKSQELARRAIDQLGLDHRRSGIALSPSAAGCGMLQGRKKKKARE